MKRTVLILTLISAVVFGATCQDKKTKDPDEQIVVKKKYDENGNITEYDSTFVHKWSSDSTFNFPEDEFFSENDFPDLHEFLKQFRNDSALNNFEFHQFGGFPFYDEDFGSHFHHSLPDSAFSAPFSLHPDSLGNFFDFHSPGQFEMPDFEKLQKQLEEHFRSFNNQQHGLPRFDNLEQREEWLKLQEKQRREREEFMKKWEQKAPEEQKQ